MIDPRIERLLPTLPETEARVLKVLQRNPQGITNFRLIQETECSRASGRVWDLVNKRGLIIVSEKVEGYDAPRYFFRGFQETNQLQLLGEANAPT